MVQRYSTSPYALNRLATQTLLAQTRLIAITVALNDSASSLNFAVFYPFDAIALDGGAPTILGLAFIDPAHLIAFDRPFRLIVLASHGAIFGIVLGISAGSIHRSLNRVT